MKNLNKKNIDVIAEARKDKKFKQYVKNASLRIRTANEIYSTRESLGITQPQLARMADTTQAIISRIENLEMSVGTDLLWRIGESLKFDINNYSRIFNVKISMQNFPVLSFPERFMRTHSTESLNQVASFIKQEAPYSINSIKTQSN
jgi:transcriptional regulator with XRE-family HTH domain